MQTASIRAARTILFALIGGLLLFAGVATAMRLTLGPLGNAQGLDLLSLLVPLLFALSGAAYVALRRALLAPLDAKRPEALALLRQGLLPPELLRHAIVGAALAEAPGLLGCICVLLGGPWLLISAPLLSIACIALLLPTRERSEHLLRGP